MIFLASRRLYRRHIAILSHEQINNIYAAIRYILGHYSISIVAFH